MGFGDRGGFRGRGGGRGGRGGRGGFVDYGPPEHVVEVGEMKHACQGDIVCKLINEKIPYNNAPIYLKEKEQIGKVDEIFGPVHEAWFSIKMSETVKASSFEPGSKFFIDSMKLLPLERFTNPSAPGRGRGSRGRGGGDSRGGGRGRGSFRGGDRGGRGGFRGGFGGGRGGFGGDRGRGGGGFGGDRGRGFRGGRGGDRGGFNGRARGAGFKRKFES